MKPCFIGIDTSNYTTSLAACDAEGRVIANLKAPLLVKSGERGLRQSDAVFSHVKNLPGLMVDLREAVRGYEPLAVGVSATPRDAKDSYMPCFLSGRSAAYSYAAAANIPVYELSHQNGHIMAALYSAGATELIKNERFIAFHVSGGTTEALLVRGKGDGFDVQLVGETSDINAGQAIDRVGVALGLDFPCGARLEALAAAYTGKIYSHPVCVKDAKCNLSGVENIAGKLIEAGESREAVAAFVFDFIGKTLERMCEQVIEKYGEGPVIFAGGVMSNKLMRARLLSKFDAHFAQAQFSADNAAGIALLAREKYLAKI